MSKPQQTIKQAISYKGIGLHSGEPVNMVFKPAPEHTGIVFVRTDIEGTPSVRAHIDNVTNTMRATTLEDGEAKVFTVEHVLAAFSAMNIDNCYIEMDSPEPAVADGSSAVFVDLILQAGIEEQSAKRNVYKVKKSHAIYDGDRFVIIVPYDGYRITFTSVNSHPLLGTQQCDVVITEESFQKEIAAARTIGFVKELEQLQAMGLAKGGNTDNALVYDDETCLSVPRFDDELVRHKALDVIGDLCLLGPIEGHIIALKSSHELNSKLARSIMEEIRETQQ
ncbi:UDP-3-O-acyl-N-acetylglucosamine deacetylase [Veillonella agrestimuris]|uniref:UDP-3-O-acyl-N-acetylglucosamine deacetylase n=1 Tax=Veillonella agrestimuris TaxID=2941340 RepID=UPI00203D6555|nr:UDP-3-O-acyl-N-acetylglucosamine deacetylase [Veillonella agrestimuris]